MSLGHWNHQLRVLNMCTCTLKKNVVPSMRLSLTHVHVWMGEAIMKGQERGWFALAECDREPVSGMNLAGS